MKESAKKQYNVFSCFTTLSTLVFILSFLYIFAKSIDSYSHSKEVSFLNGSNEIIEFISDRIENMQQQLKLFEKYVNATSIENNFTEFFKILDIHNKELENSFISNLSWANTYTDLTFKINKITHNNLKESKDLKNLNFKPHMQEMDLEHSLHFRDYDVNYLKNNHVIPFSFPIHKHLSGKYIGSITAEIDLNKIIPHLKKFSKKYSISYALLSSENLSSLIYSNNFNMNKLNKLVNIISTNNSNFKKLNYEIDCSNFIIYKMHPFPFILIVGDLSSYNKFHNYLDMLNKKYSISSIAFILVLVIFNYLFYRYIICPFLVIYNSAKAINNQQSYEAPKNLYCKEATFTLEILKKIEKSLSNEKELSTALYEANKKLSISNLELEKLIDKRTEEMEERFKVKNASFDQLSSELITPLTTLSHVSNNLVNRWKDLNEESKFDLANQVAFSMDKILSLANYFKEMSSLSRDGIKLNISNFDIVALTREIIRECQFLYINNINKKSISIELDNDSTPIYVNADKEKLSKAILNLFINSIKNTNNNSFLAAKIIKTHINLNNQEEEAVQFIINDISSTQTQGDLTSIFSATLDKPSDLSLLGLKICNKIIISHYGKMWTYENKDGGNCFNFIIPILPFKQEKELENIPLAKNLSRDKVNILAIDDEESCLGSLELMLCNSPYNLIKCNSAEDGLVFLKKNYQQISLVLLDLMMPDMYGLNVLSKIKDCPELSTIPVILQTGTSDKAEIKKAFSMGISCFIRKPYNRKLLILEIEKALKIKDIIL